MPKSPVAAWDPFWRGSSHPKQGLQLPPYAFLYLTKRGREKQVPSAEPAVGGAGGRKQLTTRNAMPTPTPPLAGGEAKKTQPSVLLRGAAMLGVSS